MDHTELILAAHVRAIAIEKRKAAAAIAARSGARIAEENFDTFHQRFAGQHPLTEFAREALEELEDIANAMKG